MERSVVQNLYHPKQAVYRGLEDLNCEYFIPSLGPKVFLFIIYLQWKYSLTLQASTPINDQTHSLKQFVGKSR